MRVLILGILLSILSTSLCGGELTGRVVKVVDGDTITILVTCGMDALVASATQHKIRLQGIDAPEKEQAFGNASRQYLARMVAGRDVRVAWQKRDRYYRILGTVFAEGKDVNLEMLKAGLAWHYKKYDSTPAYAQAESTARAAKRGLWQDKKPIEPHEFRKTRRERSAGHVKEDQ